MKKDKKVQKIDIPKILQNQELIVNAIQAGINAALLKHKQAGNPVCGWENGKVIWIAPEQIQIKS